MIKWKEPAKLFFDRRASYANGALSIPQLCYMSGRDPRVWGTREAQQALANNISSALGLAPNDVVLEIGCGCGYIAAAVVPRVQRYVGVDMAPSALRVARSLNLHNAEFREAEGENLPFADNQFDHAILHDVITNFPSFDDVDPVIQEMYRVVRPGGRILVGSVPDATFEADMVERVKIVAEELISKFGAVDPRIIFGEQRNSTRLASWLHELFGHNAADFPDKGHISCYYFKRENFSALAKQLGADLNFESVCGRSPYADLRFHAVFIKPGV